MATVKVSFTGICGFVPKKPQYQSQNQVRVLMVDGGPVPQGGAKGGHEVHVPVLVCDTQYVQQTGNDSNGVPWRKGDLLLGSESIFFLAEQDLSIVGTGADGLSFVHGSGGSGCHSTPDRDHCDWLAKISALSGASGKVRAGCLATTGSVDSDVGARCALTEGSLSTQALAQDVGSNRVVEWEFKTMDPQNPQPLPNQTQALSEVMLYEVSYSGSSVDLRTELMPGRIANSTALQRAFAPPLRVRHIRLHEDSSQQVTAKILNVPLPDLLDLRPPAPTGWRGVDHHFDLFYRPLVVAANRVPRVPWPLAQRCPGAGPPGAGNPQCPGTEYDNDPGA